MADMRKDKYPMPEQDPDVRNNNFSEVALGYTEELAVQEAARCLNCKHKPCIKGCPVKVDIPRFIMQIKEGNIEEAYQIIAETNSLPAVCGRVCPQESQCEELCVRAIKGQAVGIGRLERFAADWHMDHTPVYGTEAPAGQTAIKKSVGVIGAGPAGLTCAGDMARKGYDVTVYEAFHDPGGVLTYGIPEFRLPKNIVKKEISILEKLGIDVKVNMVIGKILTIDELLDKHDTVFIGTGAGLPRFMKIPGENLNGVYSANEFLTRINLMKAYKFPEYDTPVKIGKNAAVIGGGNVAMDAARSAKRLGAENVYIIYRRGEGEQPARLEEIHHAKEEGIIFKLLENPVSIKGDDKGNVTQIECVSMELGEPDDSGRRRPVTIKGSEHLLDMETVIVAIGQTPNPLIKNTTEKLKTASWGGIIVNEETMETSIPGVYAGGDIVTGAATVILAMGAGKTAADAMDTYLRAK